MDTLHAMLQERRGTADLEDDFSIVRLVFC